MENFIQFIEKRNRKVYYKSLVNNEDGNYVLEDKIDHDHLISAVFIKGIRKNSILLTAVEQALCTGVMSLDLIEESQFHNLDRDLEFTEEDLIDFKKGVGGDLEINSLTYEGRNILFVDSEKITLSPKPLGNGKDESSLSFVSTYAANNNVQMTLFETSDVNKANSVGFRFLVGGDVPTIDAVSGTGGARKNVNIGVQKVGIGGFSSQSDIKAKLDINGDLRIGRVLDGEGSVLVIDNDGFVHKSSISDDIEHSNVNFEGYFKKVTLIGISKIIFQLKNVSSGSNTFSFNFSELGIQVGTVIRYNGYNVNAFTVINGASDINFLAGETIYFNYEYIE